ncbi:hypothetical protein CNMCM8927_009403 [Aspergillus lentulus]|uniref:NACHT domain-containing protein n=1 Tax=Aspergillus lentulus TaxID=293939 RepID=A0AAN5YMH7_ASPLE|nr:hypothetical protein CNMCM8927_009403 [Aspergillus lentulus]
METKTKRLSHDAYTVALLTPLEIELSAVRYMLDEEHQPLPNARGDPNYYILGRLCQHNVVIASLPAGYQGTVSAAVVARDLARTFPSVTLRLLVGIGGGVPSDKTDIRLGDVVVSVPSGTQGGVVQYDLGKQTTTGFQRKGFLCPPPNEWLAILPRMQSDHRVRSNMVSSHIGDMLRRFPSLSEYERPSSEMDILFKSDYDHCMDQPTCQSCDRQMAVPRQKRDPPDRPFIHYGVIASGDRVMKNAKERDMISKSSEGAICFEMEAAGLMNDFRCIVIRGISDYADSHKNDIWHPYAAAAAAGLAKELLSGAIRKLIKDVKMLAATIQSSRAAAALKAFYTGGKRLNIERISGQSLPMSRCYINLAVVKRSLEVDEHHQSFSLTSRLKVQADEDTDIIPLPSLFEPRTGSSQTPSVPKRILIEGRAGVGKTTLCKKIVYDNLHHQMWNHLFDWVLWVPLRKLRRRAETTAAYNLENMFYDEYFSQQPDGKDLARALWQAVNDPSLSCRVLFLLDGLDEISREWDTDTPMHDFVSHLLKQPQVIITTRPRPSDQIDLGTVDLELETIGFLPEQVNNYIKHPEIVPDGETATEIESFLQKHTLMQSLMRIPIQLDALCYSWERDLLEGRSQTMTSIYEAIVLKLWKKDILQLGIRDNQGMRLTEGRVKDIFESDIEDYMFNEINLIEGLAFHGLTNDIIEFRLKDRKSFYNHFKRHGEKRPHDGERVLRKVSFLRTSDDTLQTHEQSFHFLHLTFQEFFAARYFVRHWLQDKSLPLFRVGQQSTKHTLMAPRLFLQAKKYDLHYNIYWRFVAGLLQNRWQSNVPSGELMRDFFDQLDREPRDMVGPAHQRLTMHCLSEVAPSSDDEVISERRSSLEERLLQWVELECKLSSYPEMAAEMECPSRIITRLLGPGYERHHKQIIETLCRRKVQISQDVLDAAASLLKRNAPGLVRLWAVDLISRTPDRITAEIERILVGDLHHEAFALRRYTARALFERFLSQNAIQDLVLLLRHHNENIITDSVDALKAAVDLPENVIQNLMSLFRDEKIVYPNGTPVPLLAPQNKFSDSTIRSLGTHLKDNMSCVRYRAAAALEVKKNLLPDWIIHNLVQLLEDESSNVRSAACKALCAQKSLPKEVLFDIIPVLNKRAEFSRDGFLSDETEHAIMILRSQLVLPDDIRHALSLLLKAEASCTRFAAGWALASQDNLSDETLNSMGLLLEEPNVNLEQLRRTFRFFEHQESLRRIGLRALHRRLKDHNSEVRDLAAYELGGWLPLSDEILRDLVLCLKDPETRWSAEITLGKHSAIPDEIIQSFLDLLMDEDPDVRDSAAAALDSQKELPPQLLHSLVFVLSHCQDGSACAATNWLKRQRRLPGDITEALARLLDSDRWVVKNNAMTVLLEQLHLEENVLHDIAMLQFYPRIKYRYAWSSRLSSRSDLPPKTVKALAALLEKDNPSHVEEVLRVQSCFYPLVPTLSRQALKNLFRFWIPLAFDTQICCFLDKGKLIIDGPKGRFELDFESDQQRKQFIQVIRQVQMDLGFPTAGTSSDEQTPECAGCAMERPNNKVGSNARVLDAPLVSECKPGVVSRFRCLEHTGSVIVLATIAILIQLFLMVVM